MEKKWEVKTYEVHYICDDCGNGEMVPERMILDSLPPQYSHICTECENTEIFSEIQYPYTTTEKL